jgi:hypothetical protein
MQGTRYVLCLAAWSGSSGSLPKMRRTVAAHRSRMPGAAMSNGRCRMHGGASTGPRTAEGLARCTAAPTKHDQRNAEARARAAQRGRARTAIAEMRRLLAMAEAGDPGIEVE